MVTSKLVPVDPGNVNFLLLATFEIRFILDLQ